MNATFFVLSSNGQDYYTVDIKYKNGLLTAKCNCTAGLHDQPCKHKVAVICGDESVIDDERDIKKFRKFRDETAGSESLTNVINFLNRTSELEKQKVSIDKELKAVKGEFGRKLRDGI